MSATNLYRTLQLVTASLVFHGTAAASDRTGENGDPRQNVALASKIPLAELAQRVAENDTSDSVCVRANEHGASLRTEFQKLRADVTTRGLWLESTEGAGGRFQIMATEVGRSGDIPAILADQGRVAVADESVRFSRPGLIEEYRVSTDGVRQDFIVPSRPTGDGGLEIQLAVRGAAAEQSQVGVRLTLDDGGRKMTYGRLKVTDAKGRVLPATMSTPTPISITISVADHDAAYPLRVDPTFSDADWETMNAFGVGIGGDVYAAAATADGKIYIGGSFTHVGGSSDGMLVNHIVMWTGSSWEPLGAGIGGDSYSSVKTITINGSDVYVGGSFATAGGIPAKNIAKWNGTAWSAFGNGTNDEVRTSLYYNNALYIGGTFTTAGGNTVNCVAKWSGNSWSPLSTGINGSYRSAFVESMALLGSTVCIGGRFSSAGGVPASNVASWNGSGWSNLGLGTGGAVPDVRAMAVSGSYLYIGGEFASAGSATVAGIARWDGSNWSGLGTGVSGWGSVYSLAIAGSNVYAGGDFTNMNGVRTSRIAVWNGTIWSGLGNGLSGTVRAIVPLNGNVHAFGMFGGTDGVDTDADFIYASAFATWNGSKWSAPGSGIGVDEGQIGSQIEGAISSVASIGSDIFVAGDFLMAGGKRVNSIAKWDGTTWSGLGTGVEDFYGQPGSINDMSVIGGNLFVCGQFAFAGGVGVQGVAMWNGTSWVSLGADISGTVRCLANVNGVLYLGGAFSHIGGVAANSLAKWSQGIWSPVLGGVTMNSSYGEVFALCVSGSDLLVGGEFIMAGSVPALNVARLSGNVWHPLGGGVGDPSDYWTPGTVNAIAVNGSNIYCGGEFDRASGVLCNNVALWNGATWNGLGLGTNARVLTLAAYDGGVFAGGAFYEAGGAPANRVAYWDGSNWQTLGSGFNGSYYGDCSNMRQVGNALYVAGYFASAGDKFSPLLAKLNLPSAGPSIPTGVIATKGTSNVQIGVSWNSSAGAESYTVYRGLTNSFSDQNTVNITNTAATSHGDMNAGLSPGRNYYYFVTAVDVYGGLSDPSVSDYGYRAMSPPTGITAGDDTSAAAVNISWSAAAGAASYQIYRNTSNTIPDGLPSIGSSNGPSYSDTTATPGATYWYFVTAIGANGTASSHSTGDEGRRALDNSGDFTYIPDSAGISITGYKGTGGAVSIPSSINGLPVIRIEGWAFQDCTSMTSITIPASVTNIGEAPFVGCSNLISITVAAQNTAYYGSSDGTLFDKNQNTLVQCPGGKSGNYAIPGGVTSIVGWAFAGCSRLIGITVPGTVTNIGQQALGDCSGLLAISVEPSNAVYSSADGVVFDKGKTVLVQCPGGKAGSYMIPGGVTRIWDGAFASCTKLTGVTIPGSVTTIGDEAFDYCTSLTSVTISHGVASIGFQSFASCSGLASIIIPGSVTSIGFGAFSYCSNLSAATFMGDAPTMESYVFEEAASDFSVYSYSNKSGFTSPIWMEYRSVKLNPPPPSASVSNVRAAQIPGTHQVRVSYQLTAASAITVQAIDGLVGTLSIPVIGNSGAILPAGLGSVTLDASPSASLPAIFTKNLRVKVIASTNPSQSDGNISNLTLLDTENPAIRDLAEVAGDESSYDQLITRNKVGVFFSEGPMLKTFPGEVSNGLVSGYAFDLLMPRQGKTKWTLTEFLGNASGPLFATNDFLEFSNGMVIKAPLHQSLPGTEVLPWRIIYDKLFWTPSSTTPIVQFNARLNIEDPTDHKVHLHKRFEFPSGLNYVPEGSEIYDNLLDGHDPIRIITAYDIDRSRIANPASKQLKLVVVMHGWNTAPDTDPFADGKWPGLMENLSAEINGKAAATPNWDLYAYRWGQDSYTGNINGNKGPIITAAQLMHFDADAPHAAGGVGLGVENGAQAAEIGYQHGLVLGKLIRDHCTANGIALQKVHFIAHSAGTWVARSASLYLKATKGSSSLTQQITLLDPYNPSRGKVDWIALGYPSNVDDSALGSGRINYWANDADAARCENIFSDDTRIAGTNETYWTDWVHQKQGRTIANVQVGESEWGIGGGKYSWDAHGGPIGFFDYTTNPEAYLAGLKKLLIASGPYSRYELWKRTGQQLADMAGWEHSLFMQEVKAYNQLNNTITVIDSGFSCSIDSPQQSPPPPSPNGPEYAPPPPASPWQRILVDVDSVGWVRAMLLPTAGGAAELAGPVRPEPHGTFSIDLSDGTVLAGVFDTSVTPVAITLTIDGVPFGQKVEKAQGTLAQAGFDAQLNAAGNMVFSMVLADGTAGMAVARDSANTGWEGAGVGTVNANGAFTITGADGLQVTGQLQAGGGLDPQATTVVAPLVPDIHVLDAAGGGLASGVASKGCGSVQVGGTSSALAITVKNTGTVDLTNLALSIDGTNAVDFAVTALGFTSMPADSGTTLYVTFAPSAEGNRTARLRIASNDANENPFDIALTGLGFTATPLAAAGNGANGTLAAGAEDFYRVTVPGTGILITWSEDGTDTYGSLLNSGGVVLDQDNDSDLQANFRASTVVAAGDYFISVKGVNEVIAGGYTVRSRFISAQEPIQISFLERTGNDVNLGFTNRAGVIYGIQASDDLESWMTMTTVTGEGAEMLVPLSGLGASPTTFFRVSQPLLAASYSSWSAGYFFTESNPDIVGLTADPDHDSLPNVVEMVLGGNPKTGFDSSLLPTMERVTTDLGTGTGEYFLFIYRRTDTSLAVGAESGAEYAVDLGGTWTKAVNGVGGVTVIEDNNFHGQGMDRVRVYIPRGGNSKLFARLSVLRDGEDPVIPPPPPPGF